MRSILSFLAPVLLSGCADPYANIPPYPYDRETAQRHSEKRLGGEKFDPQESDPRLRKVFAAADAETARRVRPPRKNDMGYIKYFWQVKKQILLQKYGIHWKSPEELNPGIAYD